MTKDEALKLALEALTNAYWPTESDLMPAHNFKECAEAITAIKEALAQPWEKFCDSNCVWTDHHPDCKLEEQEPVAWLITDEKINILQVNSIQRIIDRARHAHMTDVKLRINGQDEWYQADWLKHLTRTTPPQRKLLTDEEIDKAWRSCDYTVSWEQHRIDIARAIEAAHGIKGEA